MTSARLVGSVLVRNEDLFIEQAIRNVVSSLDHVHVLDHMSDDGTPEILAALAREFNHLTIVRSRYSGDSQRPLESYANTRTWVLVIDGDCLFDPAGIAALRADLEAGAHEDVFRVRGHVLHCDMLDRNAGTASGFMAPPSRPIVQLFNFGAVASWTGCPERVHGGRLVLRDGYDWDLVLDLTELSTWEDDPLRLLHVCFLPRSSRERTDSTKGRPNLNEMGKYRRDLRGGLRRLVRGAAMDPRVRRLHEEGKTWKEDKYRRGSRVTVSCLPFLAELEAA